MANEVLKELKYSGKKVLVEAAKRDALGRTIDATYATKSEITSEKITMSLSSTEETSLDITDYSQLWLEIIGDFISSNATLNIGIKSNSSKKQILSIPVVELNDMFHAMICITDRNGRIYVVVYYNSSTYVLQVKCSDASSSDTIYFEPSGMTSSNALTVDGFAILK